MITLELSEIAQQAIGGIVLLIVGYALSRLEARPRLLWYLPPEFNFVVEGTQGPIPVNTAGVVVQNTGRAKAENVEIFLSFRPLTLQIKPTQDYEQKTLEDNQHVIRLRSLAPKESVSVQVLYYDLAPRLPQIRSDTGPVKHVPVSLM